MADDILQSTAQQFLDIYDITNNLLICKDGTTSIVLTVDAMNFGLLAEEEQDAIMYAYAGLLNSLNYPIQIVIRSQTKDVTTYLKLLEQQENDTVSEIIQKRIKTYREFVSNLIHERNVLDKKFYVVIPASPLELGLLSASSVVPGRQTFDVTSIEKSVLLEKALTILEPKRDHLISQFARIGLFSRQVNTQEIIQMFYMSYNPEASEGQNIDDSSSYTTPLVQPSIIQDIASNPAALQTATARTQQAAPTPLTQDAPQAQDTPQTQPAPQPQVATTGVPQTAPPVSAPATTPSQPPATAPVEVPNLRQTSTPQPSTTTPPLQQPPAVAAAPSAPVTPAAPQVPPQPLAQQPVTPPLQSTQPTNQNDALPPLPEIS